MNVRSGLRARLQQVQIVTREGSSASAAPTGDTAPDRTATVVTRDDVESFGRPEDTGHLGVQIDEFDIRFLSDFTITLRAVYHSNRNTTVVR